ncbi:MAG: hypothetical protein ACI8RD_003424 [Bacillariaceae sp.]|jgi:hypothetical protein
MEQIYYVHIQVVVISVIQVEKEQNFDIVTIRVVKYQFRNVILQKDININILKQIIMTIIVRTLLLQTLIYKAVLVKAVVNNINSNSNE